MVDNGGMSWGVFHSFAMFSTYCPPFQVEQFCLMRHQPWWEFSRWSRPHFKLIIRQSRPTVGGRFHDDR